MTFLIPLFFGFFFGILAAIVAFLITYQEYQKHKFSKSRLIKMSLEAAFFTLIVFVVISLVVGYVLINFVLK